MLTVMRRAVLVLVGLPLAACAAVLGLDAGDPLGGEALDGAPADGTVGDGSGALDAAGDGAPNPDGAQSADGATLPDGAPLPDGSAGDTAPPPRTEPTILCGTGAPCVPNATKCTACSGTPVSVCQPWMAPVTCHILLCDDPADCSGMLCCGKPPAADRPDILSNASCRATCDDGGLPLCDPGAPACTSGTKCRPFGGYYACQ